MKISFWRINAILLFFFLLAALILGRLFYIQVVKGDLYKALAQGLTNNGEKTISERGEIFFRNGESLAINMEWPLVFASPREVKEKETTAEKLAAVLSLDKNSLLEKLKQDNLYEVIKKRLTEAEITKIKELSLPGIYPGQEIGRYYPQETLASQVVGFLDAENRGEYGIEGHYNDVLTGVKNKKGSNIYLTLDYSVQFTVEKLLAKAKEDLDIKSGQIVVLNPNSGEILALANFPDFNPNEYAKIKDFDIFQNSVTKKIFEPGSVFKPITMAAALEEGKITPQTTYQDPGIIKIGGRTIYNYAQKTYPGDITMTQVLEKSINTGAVFAEEQIGNNQLFLDYIDKFGFFSPTGIDLDEIYSDNKELKKGYDINFATAAFGQGIEMTPLQLIRAYSVISNGGKLISPFIVKEIKDGDSVKVSSTKISDESVVSSKTISQLTSMLVSVVENGYAKVAKIPGYYIAGKTGTAQVPEGGTYSPDKTIQSFMGFLPAFNSQLVILVKLDNPKANTAEYSAVPIFHELANYLIDYYQIPPDYQQ